MLQYPVQLPPLSLSSSPKIHSGKDNSDFLRSNDVLSSPTSPLQPSPRLSSLGPLNPKRLQSSPRQPFASYPPHSAVPLSVSINQSSFPSPSSSPSPASFKSPRSPYISSRHVSSPVSVPTSIPSTSRSAANSSRPSSLISSTFEDLLSPGDCVGQGDQLQGETIRLVSIGNAPRPTYAINNTEPAREFEVVRKLGTGSYAVVYLVREVLYRSPPSEDGDMSMEMGSMELDDRSSRRSTTEYGREYALKCLSKANLDEEALAAQLSEVSIHQSLRSHPNIVTLHRTLETSSFLLLLLEYVPGEDLFYFLEQARDHYESDTLNSSTDPSLSSSRTPPTPSLLSNLRPSQLLSRTRLRLIASMFSQMCDAVAACHAQQVFHRDIKPENFIVTDGWTTSPDGRPERKVIVKLTDFGLSTTDLDSSDMDCGSAPYMSYECRNNVAPTYRPRGADVWSLGIVLINMLYHFNPWTDTAERACSSFDLFCQNPVPFFMTRFTGMTLPVAELLANRVFCLLDDSMDDSRRITASEFGAWAKELPALLGQSSRRTGSISSTQGHRLSSILASHRPSSRQASSTTTAMRTPCIPSRPISRTASFATPYTMEPSELSTVFDQEVEEQDEQEGNDVDGDIDLDLDGLNSRSTSTHKRRKRGARKNKGVVPPTPTAPDDKALSGLAKASESLAREISRASKASTQTRTSTSTRTTSSSRRTIPYEPVSMYPLPSALLTSQAIGSTSGVFTPINVPASLPSITPTTSISSSTPSIGVVKKPSKWKLSFGKNSSASATAGGRISPVEEILTSSPEPSIKDSASMSATASNVRDLIMSLDAPQTTHVQPTPLATDSSTWSRGRRPKPTEELAPPTATVNHNSRSRGRRAGGQVPSRSPNPSLGADHWPSSSDLRSGRAISPNSVRSGRPVASSASSMVSGNWRSSVSTASSAGTSTSAFTRYSNSSLRSVSTTATSVSATSWRTNANGKPPSPNKPAEYQAYPNVPKNIKLMNGIPWELTQAPRGLNPHADNLGGPPIRKQRTRKPKDLSLDTISERPHAQKAVESSKLDASTSTTDLSGMGSDGDGPKKVPKGQINALAKMLSALRR